MRWRREDAQKNTWKPTSKSFLLVLFLKKLLHMLEICSVKDGEGRWLSGTFFLLLRICFLESNNRATSIKDEMVLNQRPFTPQQSEKLQENLWNEFARHKWSSNRIKWRNNTIILKILRKWMPDIHDTGFICSGKWAKKLLWETFFKKTYLWVQNKQMKRSMIIKRCKQNRNTPKKKYRNI